MYDYQLSCTWAGLRMKSHITSQHVSVYADELRAKMEREHKFARLHLQLRSDQMKGHYGSSIGDGKSLQKGDPVWLYWPQQRKGLSPKLII